MRHFLSWLVGLFGYRLAGPNGAALPDLAYTPKLPWREEHRREWLGFLRTPAGERLENNMRAVEQFNLLRACRADEHLMIYAARAGGFSECCEWLRSLTQASCDSDESTQPTNGQSSLRDRLAP